MDYRCPNCNTDLKWRLTHTTSSLHPMMLHGKKVVIVLKCPKCNIKLGHNSHKIEQMTNIYLLFNSILLVFIVILNQFDISKVIMNTLFI